MNGARAENLPVELSTRFELVVNLTTAKALSLTVSQSLMVRAEELMQ